MAPRETFGNRFAVIMAMAGSAVGLGNIWRFPYMVGEHGGAAFVLLYILASLLLALPIFLSESIIGRRSRSNTVGAFRSMAPGTFWNKLSIITVITPIFILSYYSVVGGWSVEYLFKALAFDFNNVPPEAIPNLFGTFISSTWQPVITHTAFLGLVALVVLAGVKKGIENFTKYTMPVLFMLILAMAAFSISLPGAKAGVAYLVKPDFSKIDASCVAAAMGQAFFSLSLGVGTILTYASYVSKDENLISSGAGTAVSDLLFALIAGFAIMPAVFAAGIAPEAGPSLIFQTIPFIFNKMGGEVAWISAIIAVVFFITILFAALTSAISMLEVGVAYLVEEKGFTRKKATLLLFVVAWILGVLCSLSFGPLQDFKILGNTVFDFFDKLCSNFLMTFGGLLFTIFAGWQMKKAEVQDELTNGGRLKRNSFWFRFFYFLIRYVCPVGVVVVFLTNLFL